METRMSTMTDADAQDAFAQQRAALTDSTVTVELGFAFTLSGSVQTARILREESYETRGGAWKTRKVPVGPLLVAPTEDNTRQALLRQLADIIDMDQASEPVIINQDVKENDGV